jgi:hypothetical protein
MTSAPEISVDRRRDMEAQGGEERREPDRSQPGSNGGTVRVKDDQDSEGHGSWCEHLGDSRERLSLGARADRVTEIPADLGEHLDEQCRPSDATARAPTPSTSAKSSSLLST